jgi:alkenylglycerophosphocholine/alkenylglycerophosphoethanolamine hydrolase
MSDALAWSSPLLVAWLSLFFASGAVGVFAAETGRSRLLCVAKPVTTMLLLGVIGVPHTPFAGCIAAGVLFSLVGDVALLFTTNGAFMVGLASFLVAHILYTVAFISRARLTGSVLLYAAAIGLVTLLLLRRLWAGAGGMRAPVAIYGAAIATMAASAHATTAGGTLAPVAGRLAAAGALLFFISDSTLALAKFSRPIRHAALVTLGVYWLGQLGIALAARLA